MNRFASLLLLSTLTIAAQGLDPAAIVHPSKDSWPTHNGDYSGKRFSALKQIDKSNVNRLSMVWAFQTDVNTGPGLKSTPLLVDGTLYFTEPDDVWSVDARSGQQNWHYRYHQNEGLHIGQRGVGMWKGRLYFETPDAHLLCLDARNGELLWNIELADVKLGYWATMAPLIIRNHVLVGVSGDFNDLHGFIDSINAETGKLEWRWDSLPKSGQPGSETWPANSDAIQHGGGMTWVTGTYDPEANLVFWGTANPNPVLDGSSRPGDNLYTCSIVALDPDTGKLAWYFQPSPHDVHDWDAVQTPVIYDGDFQGQARKLLIQASRNGYLFVLDRINGKPLLSAPYEEINWSSGVDPRGRPIARREKDPSPAGTLVEPDAIGATNWMSPSFDPETGLLYVDTHDSFSLYYAYSNGKAEGFGGRDLTVWSQCYLRAIDYQTGKSKWKHELGSGWDWTGVLSTAGGVVFTADVHGNILGLDAATGKTLWHVYGGGPAQGPPITYELDGRQYLLVGAHGAMYAFALPETNGAAKIPVVLSTDVGNEIDDQWAIAYLLAKSDYDVQGIISAHAPSLPDPSAHATYKVLVDEVENRLGMAVHPPLLEGSSLPLADTKTPRPNRGTDFLIETSKSFSKDHRLIVLTIGAATDVASAILTDPSIVNRIQVVAMGFRDLTRAGNEYNVENDVAAWQVILNSDVPTVIGAGDVCRSFLALGFDQAKNMLSNHGKVGAWLWDEYQDWYFRNVKPLRKADFSRPWVIWDIITLAYEEGLTTQKTIPRPTLNDDKSFGKPIPGKTITWIESVDAGRLWPDFLARLDQLR